MLPPESNPERRQVKVNSRHRLHHAAELPALGQAGNMVFCAYISPAGEHESSTAPGPAPACAQRVTLASLQDIAGRLMQAGRADVQQCVRPKLIRLQKTTRITVDIQTIQTLCGVCHFVVSGLRPLPLAEFAGRVGVYQTETFRGLRSAAPELDQSCIGLEALLR